MSRIRQGPGGDRVVDVAPARLTGWLNRFASGHGGMREVRFDQPTGSAETSDPVGSADQIVADAADGSRARLAVPFGPLVVAGREPIEALLVHLASIGEIGLVLFRAGAHSVGLASDGVVTASSTDTHYVQGRTAAGGWSQQRFARRRGNQRDAALEATVRAAARVLGAGSPRALVLAGDQQGLDAVIADPHLRGFAELPRRVFTDVAEPRRAVLDDVAGRSLDVTVTVRNA